MIEGTKPFRKKGDAAFIGAAEKSSMNSCEPANIKPLEEICPGKSAPEFATQSPDDAPNPSRREWFSGLVPALGTGLVKILRESNHLQREFNAALHGERDDK